MPTSRQPPVDHDPASSETVPPLAALLGGGRLGAAAGLFAAAADLLVEETVRNGRPSPARIEGLVKAVADDAAVADSEARALLYLASIRDPTRLSLPLQKTVEIVVTLFQALGPVEAASLWLRGPDGKLVEVTAAGEAATTRTARAAAAAAIAGRDAAGTGRNVHAVAISTRPAAIAYRLPALRPDRRRGIRAGGGSDACGPLPPRRAPEPQRRPRALARRVGGAATRAGGLRPA